MKEPTEAQIKEFWEWCGFEFNEDWAEYVPYKDPQGIIQQDGTPIDLNNLFKYAVPKKIDGYRGAYQIEITGVTLCGNWCEITYNWAEDGVSDHEEASLESTTPALALFWTIYKVMK